MKLLLQHFCSLHTTPSGDTGALHQFVSWILYWQVRRLLVLVIKATGDKAVVLYFRLPKHAAWQKENQGWYALTDDKQTLGLCKGTGTTSDSLVKYTTRLTSLFIWEKWLVLTAHNCVLWLSVTALIFFCHAPVVTTMKSKNASHTASLQQQVRIACHHWWASCNLTDNLCYHIETVLQVMLATYQPVPLKILQVWTAICAEKWSHCAGYCSQSQAV